MGAENAEAAQLHVRAQLLGRRFPFVLVSDF